MVMAQTDRTHQEFFFTDLIERATAAELLGVHPRTLDRWHLFGDGPPRILVGRQVRYRLSAIQGWLVARESSALSAP